MAAVVPTGAVKWRHRGQVESDEIAAVLTEHLKASRPAEFVEIRPGTAVGDQIAITLEAGKCPPVPLRRPWTTGSKVMFVDTGHASATTLKQLERATTEHDDPPYIAVVVDGASADEVHALQAELGLDVPMFPDRDGAVTRRAGMRFTPAVVTIDPLGRLREIAPTSDMTSGLRRRRRLTSSGVRDGHPHRHQHRN